MQGTFSGERPAGLGPRGRGRRSHSLVSGWPSNTSNVAVHCGSPRAPTSIFNLRGPRGNGLDVPACCVIAPCGTTRDARNSQVDSPPRRVAGCRARPGLSKREPRTASRDRQNPVPSFLGVPKMHKGRRTFFTRTFRPRSNLQDERGQLFKWGKSKRRKVLLEGRFFIKEGAPEHRVGQGSVRHVGAYCPVFCALSVVALPGALRGRAENRMR